MSDIEYFLIGLGAFLALTLVISLLFSISPLTLIGAVILGFWFYACTTLPK